MKTIFEKSNGVDGVCIGETEEIKLEGFIPKELLREGNIGLPQLSELEVLRSDIYKKSGINYEEYLELVETVSSIDFKEDEF